MDMNSENWEFDTSLPDLEEELKKMRKNLRKRTWTIVLTSVVLVAALFAGTVKYAIPAIERLYWYPEEQHFSSQDSYTPKSLYDPSVEETGVTDLQITLQTYYDLFCPGQTLLGISSLHTGFTTYLLSIPRLGADQQLTTDTLTLEKGKLQVPQGFWQYPPYFALRTTYPEEARDLHKEVLKAGMEPLPDYIQVSAYVTFQEDISVLDLLKFQESFIADNSILALQSTVLWMAVRHTDPANNPQILCGMNVSGSSIRVPEMNKTYPCFDDFAAYEEKAPGLPIILNVRAGILEERFQSMLRYSDDQLKAGRGISVNGDESYYQNALAYVEENGVNVYGCYIVTTPQRICEMMDWENIGYIYTDQIWIG